MQKAEKSLQLRALNLEWASHNSRDRESATLVFNFLDILGVQTKEDSIFRSYQACNIFKPHLVYISCTIGAKKNIEVSQRLVESGIPVITSISECPSYESYWKDPKMFWGWNTNQRLHENLMLFWNQNSLDMAKSHLDKSDFEKMIVTGGATFDKYKILKKPFKKDVLSKYGKGHYTTVVGYACWDFSILNPEDTRYEFNKNLLGVSQLEMHRKDRVSTSTILKQTILKFPNILFLIKIHPSAATRPYSDSGLFEEIKQMDNVLVIANEESIHTCISISDMWTVYESTTALEAWILEKPTLLLNPSGRHFNRDIISDGSPAVTTESEFYEQILSSCETGTIKGFQDLEDRRKSLIHSIIGWADGLNHVRIASAIHAYMSLHANAKRKNIPKYKIFEEFLKWSILPTLQINQKHLKYYRKNRMLFQKEKLFETKNWYLDAQMSFYENKKKEIEDIREEYFQKICTLKGSVIS